MTSFAERFRNKSSVIGREGNIPMAVQPVVNPGKPPLPSPSPERAPSAFAKTGSSILANYPKFNTQDATVFARKINLSSNSSIYSSYEQSRIISDTQSEVIPAHKPITAATNDTNGVTSVALVSSEAPQQQNTVYKVAEKPKRTLTAVAARAKVVVPRRPGKLVQSVNMPLSNIAESEERVIPAAAPRRKVDYTPYTLSDFKKKDLDYKGVKLGGLGASNVGTDSWSEKKALYDKRRSYAGKVQTNNTAHLNDVANQVRTGMPDMSSAQVMRMKALEFSKNIKKPKLKPPKPTAVQHETIPLEPINQRKFLEEEHSKYIATLEALRAKIDLC